MNVCPDGSVYVDDIYVSSLISALPETWTLVTAPLELQPTVTPSELKKVLRGHAVKLKNRDTSSHTSSTALSTTAPSRKSRVNNNSQPKPDCDYFTRRGHLSDVCHKKQMDDQRREIDSLKDMMKKSKLTELAKLAHVSDSESDDSLDNITSAEAATASLTNRIKFLREAAIRHQSHTSNELVFNADTGCTDSLVKSTSCLDSHKSISPTPISWPTNPSSKLMLSVQ